MPPPALSSTTAAADELSWIYRFVKVLAPDVLPSAQRPPPLPVAVLLAMVTWLKVLAVGAFRATPPPALSVWLPSTTTLCRVSVSNSLRMPPPLHSSYWHCSKPPLTV